MVVMDFTMSHVLSIACEEAKANGGYGDRTYVAGKMLSMTG